MAHDMVRTTNRLRFHKVVVVQLGRIDRDRVICDAADAAKVLLEDWPAAKGEKHSQAMKACLGVFKGVTPAREARKAFITAAIDARIYIGDHS